MPRWLLVACAVTLAGCAGVDVAPDARPSTEVGRAGVTIALPDGWRALPPNDGNITDPLTRIAIGSGSLRAQIAGCETQITRYAPQPDSVSLVVVEWKEADPSLPRRPSTFGGDALRLQPGTIDCFAPDGGAVQFTERGHVFGVYLLVGERADRSLAQEARRALDTLRIEARR